MHDKNTVFDTLQNFKKHKWGNQQENQQKYWELKGINYKNYSLTKIDTRLIYPKINKTIKGFSDHKFFENYYSLNPQTNPTTQRDTLGLTNSDQKQENKLNAFINKRKTISNQLALSGTTQTSTPKLHKLTTPIKNIKKPDIPHFTLTPRPSTVTLPRRSFSRELSQKIISKKPESSATKSRKIISIVNLFLSLSKFQSDYDDASPRNMPFIKRPMTQCSSPQFRNIDDRFQVIKTVYLSDQLFQSPRNRQSFSNLGTNSQDNAVNNKFVQVSILKSYYANIFSGVRVEIGNRILKVLDIDIQLDWIKFYEFYSRIIDYKVEKNELIEFVTKVFSKNIEIFNI